MQLNQAFEMVRHALGSGRVANGYLIVGSPRGSAMELAVKVLQMLFCRSEVAPCGSCEGCRKVSERVEPDIVWLFPEKKSRIIGVDAVRDELLYVMEQTSVSGGWKAGVLVGADRLNESAANILLKTLEEPPPKTLFLLLSDAPQQLLPTIISRCQRINLMLDSELAEPWRSRVLEVLSGTLYRTPLERLAMSNQLYIVLSEMRESAEQLVVEESEDEGDDERQDRDVWDARVEARYRELRKGFVLTLQNWFRDLLLITAGGDESLLYVGEHADVIRERAGQLTLAQAAYNMHAIDELAQQMERTLSEESVLGYAVDRMFHGVRVGR